MRRFLLAVTGVAMGATACGLSVTGTALEATDARIRPGPGSSADSRSASVDEAPSGTPPKVTSFPCGGQTCATGVQACCAIGTTYACSEADAGCPAADGDSGGPPPPPLWCTSSSECNGQRRCCYRPKTGSACAKSCASDELELCSHAFGGCGENGECIDMSASPAPTVGQCDYREDS